MIFLLDKTIQSLLFVGGLIGLYVLVVGLRYQVTKKRGVVSPFVESFLRLPGHSERRLRLELFDKLSEKYDLFLLSGVLLLFSFFFIDTLFGLFGILFAVVGIVLALYQALNLHTRLQVANLKCDGEEYTGQELNYLHMSGAYVFHDIPTPNGNIDHVVIANDKVFVVENAVVGKSQSSDVSTVKFDGETLQFPDFEIAEPIDIAMERADFIANRITEYCNLDFQVMPVVSIPGWHIEITKKRKAKILAINPKRGIGLKAWLGPRTKSESREAVLNYLESVARSIPPRSKRSDSKAEEKYEFWMSPRYKEKILED